MRKLENKDLKKVVATGRPIEPVGFNGSKSVNTGGSPIAINIDLNYDPIVRRFPILPRKS